MHFIVTDTYGPNAVSDGTGICRHDDYSEPRPKVYTVRHSGPSSLMIGCDDDQLYLRCVWIRLFSTEPHAIRR